MLEQTIASISESREALERVVVELMDDYWEWFTIQCKAVMQAKARGEDMPAGRVAPVMEKKKSGDSKKTYIKWKDFGGQRLRQKNPNMSFDFVKAATEDYRAVIKSRSSWEMATALELEEKLIPLRLQITGLHAAEVKLRATQRKLNKITKEE